MLHIHIPYPFQMCHDLATSPQDDAAEADKFVAKWKALSEVEKAKKKEEDDPGPVRAMVRKSYWLVMLGVEMKILKLS